MFLCLVCILCLFLASLPCLSCSLSCLLSCPHPSLSVCPVSLVSCALCPSKYCHSSLYHPLMPLPCCLSACLIHHLSFLPSLFISSLSSLNHPAHSTYQPIYSLIHPALSSLFCLVLFSHAYHSSSHPSTHIYHSASLACHSFSLFSSLSSIAFLCLYLFLPSSCLSLFPFSRALFLVLASSFLPCSHPLILTACHPAYPALN